ncbi:MAG: hypothetical protein JW852_06335 [Spirochaetales bacterium]|nr:hypothetical protein [Spirochaetales bacterium]
MKREGAPLEGMPREGFLKISLPEQARLSANDRVALIRKGNEFFNAGRIEDAKKIFITTRYGDGLARIGDYYVGKQDPLEALRMYWIAPAPQKRERLVEKAAGVVRTWMMEGLGKNGENTTGRSKSAG